MPKRVQCAFTDTDGTTYAIEASSMFDDVWMVTKERNGVKEGIADFPRWVPPRLTLVATHEGDQR